VIHDPSLRYNGHGVRAFYDANGDIVLNSAAPGMDDEATVRSVAREEAWHADAATEPVAVMLDEFMTEHPLSEEQVAELQSKGYLPNDGESVEGYRRRLHDEFVGGKAYNKLPWLMDWVERAWVKVKEMAGGKLTQAQAARYMIRQAKKLRVQKTSSSTASAVSSDVSDGTVFELDVDTDTLTQEERQGEARRHSLAPPKMGKREYNRWLESMSPAARAVHDFYRPFVDMESTLDKQAQQVWKTPKKNAPKQWVQMKKGPVLHRSMTTEEMNRWSEKNPFVRDAFREIYGKLDEPTRKSLGMNPDGTFDLGLFDKEGLYVYRSFMQRLMDARNSTLHVDAPSAYLLGSTGATVNIAPPGIEGAVRVPADEAYRQEIIKKRREQFARGELQNVSKPGAMSFDSWGTMGFTAANSKTIGSGDFTTICPQMYISGGCFYCYRRAALESNINVKLGAEKVWYTGEFLRLSREIVAQMNRVGGFRIQSFGDFFAEDAQTRAMIADMLYDAEMVGLQIKIITKDPRMIDFVAQIRNQRIPAKTGFVGEHLFFNLSADYFLEKRGTSNEVDQLDAHRPFAAFDEQGKVVGRDKGEIFWKRALTVDEANAVAEQHPWVNIRTVALTVEEFVRGLLDPRVHVVTGYHGHIREMPRITVLEDGGRRHDVVVEPIGDNGMPRFTKNGTPLFGKKSTIHHRKLAYVIAKMGLIQDYYRKSCCITGKCASCKTLCGAPAASKYTGGTSFARSELMKEGPKVLAEVLREWDASNTLARELRLNKEERIQAYFNDVEAPAFNRDVLQSIRRGFEANPARRHSLASAEAVNRIEGQAAVDLNDGHRPAMLSRRKRILESMRSPESQVLYYGGRRLLDAQRQLKLEEAYRAAAVMSQAQSLHSQIWASADKPGWSLPRIFRTGAWARRTREFMRKALPVAAHLNVVGRNPDGSFKFAGFRMRAGLMKIGDFQKGKHAVGDSILIENPVTGEEEELTIGDLITTPTGTVGYQLTRHLTAADQKAIHEHYSSEYPDLVWLVNMFIDPDLKSARMTVDGIEIPVFNRFSSAAMMADGHPDFDPVQAYTPDVLVSRGLLSVIGGQLRGMFNPRAGSKSPGRRYKTGRSRESGLTRDLVSGWSVRTWQMLTEQAHKEWAQQLISAAQAIPSAGIPDGWTQLDMGMQALGDAARRLRYWSSPVATRDVTAEVAAKGETAVEDTLTEEEWLFKKKGRWLVGKKTFPETERRMSSKGDDVDYPVFFAEVMRLRGKQLMLPTPVVNAIRKRFAAQQEHGKLWHMANWMVRQSVGSWLLHPKTIVANILTNDMFAAEAAYRHAISGLLKWDGQDLHYARNIMTGMFLNRFAGVRRMLGLGDKTEFMEMVRSILPDHIFNGSTGLSDLQMDAMRNPFDLLSRGDIAGAGLAAVGYGTIDIRAKQRLAYAFLKAAAQASGKAAGLKGAKLKAHMKKFMASPPMEKRAQAVAAANFELLNYADTPESINRFSEHWVGKMILPFPRFGYHYLRKQATRVAALRTLLDHVPAKQRADAFADVVTVGTFGFGGLGVAAYTLAGLLGGIGDDDDAREFVGTSIVKYIDPVTGELVQRDIDRSIITSNRINISYWARALGLGGDNEEDFWLRVRNYPAVAMAGAVAIAASDAKRFGVKTGARSFVTSAADLASDFFSLGMLPRVADKTVAWLRTNDPKKPATPFLDPYATQVPWSMYVTEAALDQFVPGSRQFDEMVLWVDPTERRRTRVNAIDYAPGPMEAMQIGHVTGLLDRLFRDNWESPLPPAGPVDRRTGYIEPKVQPITQRVASMLGANIRPINRQQYEGELGK
jgi:hypothetical protein